MPGIFGVINAHRRCASCNAVGRAMREILRHDRSYIGLSVRVTRLRAWRQHPVLLQRHRTACVQPGPQYVSCHGGRVFNASELRAELKTAGYDMEAANDADLMMRLYEAHGNGLAHKVNGLFIVAIWNERDSSVTLINDRARPALPVLLSGRIAVCVCPGN